MKLVYYILIFFVLGAIIGFVWGSNYQPDCPNDPTVKCAASPNTPYIFGAIGGVIGIVDGFAVGYFINSKTKKS